MKNNRILLSTKLKMPQPRKKYIIRKNLFGKLEDYVDYKLILITGGAGCGKTMLASSFIKEYDIPNTKWITLDESSNNIFSFWYYVLETVKGDLSASAEDLFALFETNFQKSTTTELLTLLLNALDLDKDFFIVFDDFHTITDAYLLETIDYFIKYCTDNIHLIILSRENPRLYLGGLNMSGHLLIIDESDLRLSQDEGVAFLENTMGLNLKKESIDYINSIAEGWIGGLQLIAAGIVNKKESEIKNIKLTNQLVNDYLTKEIFDPLSPLEKDFLIKTSILSYFNEGICNKLHLLNDFNEMINELLQKKLLIITIDEENGLYRYHNILQEYLKMHFNKLSSLTQKELHLKAALLFEDLCDFSEAINHLCFAKAYRVAMEMIIKLPQNTETLSYLNRIPTQYATLNADFALQRFFYHYGNVEIDECKEMYELIRLKMKDDPTFTAFKSIHFLTEDYLQVDDLYIPSLNELENLPLSEVTKAFLFLKNASFLHLQGCYQEAISFIEKAFNFMQNNTNPFITFFAYSSKSQILEEIGDLNESLSLYEKMQSIIASNKCLSAMKLSYAIGIIGVYLKQMNLKAAKSILHDLELNPGIKSFSFYRGYLFNLAEYTFLTGHINECLPLLDELLAMESFKNTLYLAPLFKYVINTSEQKNTLLMRYKNDYECTKKTHRTLDGKLLYTRILYKEGAYMEALELIEDILKYARKHKIKLRLIEALLLKLTMLSEHNLNPRDAVNLFREALHYAHKDKILLPFYYEREIVLKLIKRYHIELLEDISLEEKSFIKDVLALEINMPTEQSPQKKLLSERELEVLHTLAIGCSNKEIAAKLCISLATVKSHIINIYSKLGVNSRVAAIEEAKRQGLI